MIKKSKKEIVKETIKPTTTKTVQIPLAGVIIFSLLLACSSFFAGAAWLKIKNGNNTNLSANNTFSPEKSNKPVLEFYVMSFCPYGNMMETTLKPVFDLLGNKAEIRPRYIFSKISGDLATYCKQNSPDPTNCETYVKNSQGQLKDVADCRNKIAEMVKDCNNENQYLKIGNNLYSSLHGRVEANQDVREICAYNQNEDKTNWWKFVENVNTNCSQTNADTCWEEQAKKAGLDTNKITECFNKNAADLIEKEIALTDKFKIQASPSLMLNDKEFPPTNETGEALTGNIKIGKKVFTTNELRDSSAIKEAICASFKKAPKECKKELKGTVAGANDTAAPAGSCN